MNADQAKCLTQYFANMFENEGKTTAKVLAAVPDSGRDYKPDGKSRTAWELATHLALGDVWFLDSIINGKFEGGLEGSRQQPQRPSPWATRRVSPRDGRQGAVDLRRQCRRADDGRCELS